MNILTQSTVLKDLFPEQIDEINDNIKDRAFNSVVLELDFEKGLILSFSYFDKRNDLDYKSMIFPFERLNESSLNTSIHMLDKHIKNNKTELYDISKKIEKRKKADKFAEYLLEV